jgi:hypothetical protein
VSQEEALRQLQIGNQRQLQLLLQEIQQQANANQALQREFLRIQEQLRVT